MALTLANLTDAAIQRTIDRAVSAGVSSPEDIRNILLASRASTGGVVTANDVYMLSDADDGKVIVISTLLEAEAWVYLNESAPPRTGFSCSIITESADVKVGWNGTTGNINGPGMANGKWLITDATNNGVGMGATLVVKNSSTLVAHIIGAVEIIP